MHISGEYSDQELIRAIKTGQGIDGAIGFIYREYYGLLEQYVKSNNGTEEDAADTIQEVLVAFIEMIRKEKYRGQASVKSFLYIMTRNQWISELRKRSSATRRHTHYQNQRDTMEADISEYLDYKAGQQLIRALFQQMGEKCRQILTLFYYGNLSMKEILARVPYYDNEQVLRNKKYKCLKELTARVKDSPEIQESLKTLLHHVR